MSERILALATCYNRKNKTIKCLNTLINNNLDLNFNFIIVDDNSNDGTKEALRKFCNIDIIDGDGDLYYSGGMRKAINYAKKICKDYEYVLFFNDDVEFFYNSIKQLIKFHNDRKKIIVGATCDDNKVLSYGGAIKKSNFKPSFKIVMSDKYKIIECDTFNANCVLIPAKTFIQIPNIDSVYTHSLGDFDYGLSAKKMGLDIIVSNFFVGCCNDNPKVGTWQDTSLKRLERLKRKENPKGLPYKQWFHFIRKNYNLLSACFYSITPYIKILIKK